MATAESKTPPPTSRDTVSRPPVVVAPAVTRVRDGQPLAAVESVATEMPIALFYNCASHAVMMASPTDLEDFAVGFSLAEGIVANAGEIEGVEAQDAGRGLKLGIRIPSRRAEQLEGQQRNLAGRTGCGLCGVRTIEQALRAIPNVSAGPTIPAAAISAALDALPRRQLVNRASGAVHAAAFADRDGNLIAVREDVGRHNALDKVIGTVARTGRPLSDGFAIVTSRCSMEMVQKAATVGIPLLAAISAPTSLALDLARDCGLTVAAFARERGFNLYTHPDRVSTVPMSTGQ